MLPQKRDYLRLLPNLCPYLALLWINVLSFICGIEVLKEDREDWLLGAKRSPQHYIKNQVALACIIVKWLDKGVHFEKEDTVKRKFIVEEGELEPGQEVTIQLSEKLNRMKETKAASKMVVYLVGVIFVLNSTVSVAPLLEISPQTCTLAGCLGSGRRILGSQILRYALLEWYST